MDRRAFISGITLGLLAVPLPAEAQSAGTTYKIGYLSPGPTTDQSNPASAVSAFRQGLRDLGYVEGQNLVIESRYADGETGRLSSLAAELVRLKVAIIVTWGPGIYVARGATTTIPIVMASTLDAVEVGLVDSLARPGGNITGLTLISIDLMGKRLELLRAALPGVDRLAFLTERGLKENWGALELLEKATEAAAKSAGISLQVLRVRDPMEFDAAFSAMARQRADALYVVENGLLVTHHIRIVELARRHHLPTMFGVPRLVETGGLMAYGADTRDMYRRAAIYVDKILKGAKPADLPIEQPTKFDLVINLKTAKALGLTIPPSLLLRADQVIE